MGVRPDQADRHYRLYKENWKIVGTAMNKSDGFDVAKCKVPCSTSEKRTTYCKFFFVHIKYTILKNFMVLIRLYTCMQDRAMHLLFNPIKSFHEMQ